MKSNIEAWCGSFGVAVVAAAGILATASVASAATVGEWRFAEGAGATAADSSGNGRNGTLVNFADLNAGAGNAGDSGWTSDGRLAFDGVNDHVTTPLSLSTLVGKSFTIEAVVSHDNPTQTWSPFVGESNSGAGGIFFLGKQQNVNTLHYNFAGLGSTNTGVVFADGQMHHIAVVFDDTANTITSYRDGVQMAQTTGVTGTLTTTSDMWIGAVGHAAVERWNGYMDHVRISDVALAPAQFIPEPGSLALMGIAAACTLFRRRV